MRKMYKRKRRSCSVCKPHKRGIVIRWSGRDESRLKEWWIQMEGLNSLLLMHEKYGQQTDVYFNAFELQWQFIKNYQIDSQFHGVYEMVGPDGNPVSPNKGRIWKAAYHDGRALLNVSERLQRLAKSGSR